jgi:hypothetical protein
LLCCFVGLVRFLSGGPRDLLALVARFAFGSRLDETALFDCR